jgi:hypothetical protein
MSVWGYFYFPISQNKCENCFEQNDQRWESVFCSDNQYMFIFY